MSVSNPQERIPVVILTGFLGSGKTTLLNALLRDPAWADSGVVVNEFGDIGLDHLLVAEAKENIVLMDAGCLCCAVLDSLPETLADLYRRRAAGETPKFRRLLVETTGLAEPGPILRTLMRDPVVSHFYRPQGLVCTVDAMHGLDELAHHHEARAQVALADRLIVTKADLTGGVPDAVAGRLTQLNPLARVVRVDRGDGVGAAFSADVEAAPWMDPLTAEAEAHDHAHSDDVSSESFILDQPLGWPGLAAWIDQLRARYGRDLLRCKGILNVAGGPVVLHGVQTVFDTVRAAAWPDAQRSSRLVLIGRGLDRAELESTLPLLTAA